MKIWIIIDKSAAGDDLQKGIAFDNSFEAQEYLAELRSKEPEHANDLNLLEIDLSHLGA